MSVIKVKNESGEFVDIPVIQGPQGKQGVQGPQGETGPQGPAGQDGVDGTSVNVVQAADESAAISLSTQNPNNIYYWSE